MTNLWEQVDQLFAEALELGDEERSALLHRVRQQDPTAAARLEHLLKIAGEMGDFLEEPAERVLALDWEDVLPQEDEEVPEADLSGTRIGPWRIVEKVGRGGMASVYLAERADGEWRQQVALKLLHKGLDTEHVLRRFRKERQILSSLDHPGVARFLGGGSTEAGLPYLVMEYVDGIPLPEYCDREGLGLDERLRLFCEVGRVVHAAHRQLVVHRDVKPSNVLIDGQGRVRLLDFGIAKLLLPEGHALTQVEHRAVTPAYASPEQVGEGRITTASDVYQMGMLLCEVLVGRRPYEVRSVTPAGVVRAIMESVPALPSSLVTPEAAARLGLGPVQLTRQLKGDLDSIILQALEKVPEDRYESAASMVEDIQRFLRKEPVSARAGTTGYRAMKFIGRHRVGVAMAAVMAAILTLSATLFAVQAERAQRDRDRAVAEQLRAERLNSFLSDLFSVVDPAAGGERDLATSEILAEGVRRAQVAFRDQPESLADILGRIGEIYSSMSLHREAVPLLSEAIALRESGAGNAESRVQDLQRLAHAQWFVNRDETVDLLEEAIGLARDSLGADHPLLADALTQLADQHWGSPERQREVMDSAMGILRAYPEEEVGERLARALYMEGRMAEETPRQMELFGEALALRRRLHGNDHPSTAVLLNAMGLALDGVDPMASDTLLQEAAAMHQRLYGPRHRTTLTILNNRAGVLRDQGKYAEAELIYRRVLEIRTEAFPDDVMARAYILHGLGWVLAEQGRPGEAEPLLEEMLEILEEEGDDPGSWRYQIARNTLGRTLALQGRFEEAEPLLRESYEWIIAQDPEGNHEIFEERLKDLYRNWGRPDALAELDATGGGRPEYP